MRKNLAGRTRAGACVRALALVGILAGTVSAGLKVDVNGGVYPRFSVSAMGSGFELMGAEADVTARLSSRTRDIATGAVQLWAGSRMQDWTMGYHFGLAYIVVPLGLRLPQVKVGQAVIPFGLLADYDTHGQIVQTLYSKSLALRIDPGAGIQGEAGRVGYWLWVSNGAGPYAMDPDRNKALTARVAPKFLLADAELTLGASALAGRLPYFPLDSMMYAAEGPNRHEMKYRLALDNTTDVGPATIRLEGVLARDSALSAGTGYGYYAEARYAFTDWLEALAKHDGWHPPEGGSHRSLGAGVSLTMPGISNLNLQVVYGRDWMKTGEMNEKFWNFTTQLGFTF